MGGRDEDLTNFPSQCGVPTFVDGVTRKYIYPSAKPAASDETTMHR